MSTSDIEWDIVSVGSESDANRPHSEENHHESVVGSPTVADIDNVTDQVTVAFEKLGLDGTPDEHIEQGDDKEGEEQQADTVDKDGDGDEADEEQGEEENNESSECAVDFESAFDEEENQQTDSQILFKKSREHCCYWYENDGVVWVIIHNLVRFVDSTNPYMDNLAFPAEPHYWKPFLSQMRSDAKIPSCEEWYITGGIQLIREMIQPAIEAVLQSNEPIRYHRIVVALLEELICNLVPGCNESIMAELEPILFDLTDELSMARQRIEDREVGEGWDKPRSLMRATRGFEPWEEESQDIEDKLSSDDGDADSALIRTSGFDYADEVSSLDRAPGYSTERRPHSSVCSVYGGSDTEAFESTSPVSQESLAELRDRTLRYPERRVYGQSPTPMMDDEGRYYFPEFPDPDVHSGDRSHEMNPHCCPVSRSDDHEPGKRGGWEEIHEHLSEYYVGPMFEEPLPVSAKDGDFSEHISRQNGLNWCWRCECSFPCWMDEEHTKNCFT